jgi:cephalosporin-C deacetylase
VVDLIGSANIPVNTILQSVAFCGNSSTNIQDYVWSIDEVAFSADPNPRPRIKPTQLDSITCTSVIPATADGQFVNVNPVSTINLINTGKSKTKFILNVDVRTTANDPYRLTKDTLVMLAGEAKSIRYELTSPDPGFYRYNIDVTDTLGTFTEHKFHRQIVYNYEQMPTVTDAQPDFNDFWKATKDSLAAVKPEYNVTFYQNYGSHIIYKVAMKSIKGSTINGYLSVPNKPGKFPAVIVSEGFWQTCQPSSRTDDWVIINYNVRGQGISTAAITNTDVDLSVDGLKDKKTYYYRFAFMDALRAVDFAFSRPEVDTTKVFAEGASQGGALTYVIAALDSRIRAAAPTIPFLSDFPMYYKIKENVNYIDEWPMNLLNIYMKKYSLSLATTLQNWSYFDIKNFAGKIKCPILTGSGLQDPTCPPALGMADYNNLQTTKEHLMYESYGHDVSSDFYAYRDAWFNQLAASSNTGTVEIKKNDFSSAIKTYITGNALNINTILDTPIKVSIYQTDGVLVNQSNLKGSSSIHLSSGVYIIVFKNPQNQAVRKIIVQ